VDDIVNNTTGAVLGAVCVWTVRAIQKHRAAKHERALSVSAASA
jgi:putative glycopeptide antibiotics resistance protein